MEMEGELRSSQRIKYYMPSAITSVQITQDTPTIATGFTSKHALEALVEFKPELKEKARGEILIDLRNPPPYYYSSQPIEVPTNFLGKRVTAFVYCPEGSVGGESLPTQLRLFLKSSRIENGKEKLSAYYGEPHKIVPNPLSHQNDKLASYIKEGDWNIISLNLWSEYTPQESGGPLAYVDRDFDPENVVMIGIRMEASPIQFREPLRFYIDWIGWGETINLEDSIYKSLNKKKEVLFEFDISVEE
jgi:hypothetical protein